jgi:hypothetical protein
MAPKLKRTNATIENQS